MIRVDGGDRLMKFNLINEKENGKVGEGDWNLLLLLMNCLEGGKGGLYKGERF